MSAYSEPLLINQPPMNLFTHSFDKFTAKLNKLYTLALFRAIISIFMITYIITINNTLHFFASLPTQLCWWGLVWVLKWQVTTNFKQTKQKLLRMIIILIFMTILRFIIIFQLSWVYCLVEVMGVLGLSFWGGKGYYFGDRCGRYMEQVSFESRYELPNLKLRMKNAI